MEIDKNDLHIIQINQPIDGIDYAELRGYVNVTGGNTFEEKVFYLLDRRSLKGERILIGGKTPIKLPSFDHCKLRADCGKWSTPDFQFNTPIHVDVFGFAKKEKEIWIVECKWHEERIGIEILERLLGKKEKFSKDQFFQNHPMKLTLWLCTKTGLSMPAKKFAEQKGIIYSNEEQLDKLLFQNTDYFESHVSFKKAPLPSPRTS